MSKVNPIPAGMHTITPHLTIKGCAEAIEFYKKALGAEEMNRALDPSGKLVWHAAMRIGDSVFFLNDEMPGMGSGAKPASLWIYIDGVDKAFKRATDAGCQVTMPLADMFWGDRSGQVTDKWGNTWTFAQRVKEMTQAEMEKAGKEFAAKMHQ